MVGQLVGACAVAVDVVALLLMLLYCLLLLILRELLMITIAVTIPCRTDASACLRTTCGEDGTETMRVAVSKWFR